jgi:exosome complex component CSL4
MPNVVLPGDHLASIEEFEPGEGTSILAESVISARVGKVVTDMSKRTIAVVALKNKQDGLPVAGDTVIGIIESTSSSVAQVTIIAINETKSSKELSGILYLREDRRFKFGPSVKAGDTVRAIITSTVNAIYHLSLECPYCGVLFTTCSNCGGTVVALSKNRIKCTECGNVEDRSLSEDFVKLSRSNTDH